MIHLANSFLSLVRARTYSQPGRCTHPGSEECPPSQRAHVSRWEQCSAGGQWLLGSVEEAGIEWGLGSIIIYCNHLYYSY